MRFFRSALCIASLGAPFVSAQNSGGFRVEEASIQGIQSAIRAGQTTCRHVVEAYLDRVRVYNGVCTELLTKDGQPIPPSTGMVRAGAPIRYPTDTVAASTVFPDFDQYKGPSFELGRMTPSVSDPAIQLQYGLRVGIPDAGQLNALETLNIRGERSLTCKGDFDRAPSAGPLPPGAPPECEEFRKLPDALERAAELDKQYGRNPDLAKMPMYCAVFSLKDWYEAKDMRSTGGNDVNFAMDAPKADSPDIAALREKGAIIFAIATAENVGGPTTTAQVKAKSVLPMGNLQYGPWGGQACNPYDTARVPRGTSNGSAVSVAANLATCSVCEQTWASCKGPASRNNVVNLLPTKGVHMDGGIATSNAGDRAGLQCRTMADAALAMDAVKGFESSDPYTAIPKLLIPKEPYASFVVSDSRVKEKPLKGMRVGIVREFMVKHTKNDAAISDQIDQEIKTVLRDKLGAALVESLDPRYPDDPSVPNMTYTFADAMAEILPHTVPELFWKKSKTGELEFAVPGWDVTSMDYAVALSRHRAPLSPKISIATIADIGYSNPPALMAMNRYLAARGDARIKDWASWVDNAAFKSEEAGLRAREALKQKDPRPAKGQVSYLEMQSVLRMIVLKVMKENKIDVLVNPEQTIPPDLLGGAPEPEVIGRPSRSCCQILTALLGGPEAEVPAGYVTTAYKPHYVLSEDKTSYAPVTGDVASKLPHPMPISMMFWAGPGSDAEVIKVASAYEAATHHRVPSPAFGPVSAPAQSANR
jgi:Asp-tRNA(Asn)/Glu-tRNA(Gln) amidotransferase A subunit family amidase